MLDADKVIEDVDNGVPPPEFNRSLGDIPPLVPEEEDPAVLFANNWLAQGQSAMIIASSGVGKSSMAMQAAFNWASGREFLARPLRPLKCAIIQAEDSERDMADQLAGMQQGLTSQGWTPQEFNDVKSRILCPLCFTGLMGEDFARKLKVFQDGTKCDMIIINPVQAYFGGDVSDQRQVSEWVRGKLDPILKSSYSPCALLVVGHTTKICGKKEDRPNIEDYAEYIGAGSHEWTDWARAKFVFLRQSKNRDYFKLSAAKRGVKLDWKDAEGNKTYIKHFKHSDGYIFWQEVTDPDEIAEAEGKLTQTTADPKSVAEEISECLRREGASKLSDLENRFSYLAPRSVVRQAIGLLRNTPQKYHISARKVLVGCAWTIYFGLADSIREVSARDKQQYAINKSTSSEVRYPTPVRNDINTLPPPPPQPQSTEDDDEFPFI